MDNNGEGSGPASNGHVRSLTPTKLHSRRNPTIHIVTLAFDTSKGVSEQEVVKRRRGQCLTVVKSRQPQTNVQPTMHERQPTRESSRCAKCYGTRTPSDENGDAHTGAPYQHSECSKNEL